MICLLQPKYSFRYHLSPWNELNIPHVLHKHVPNVGQICPSSALKGETPEVLKAFQSTPLRPREEQNSFRAPLWLQTWPPIYSLQFSLLNILESTTRIPLQVLGNRHWSVQYVHRIRKCFRSHTQLFSPNPSHTPVVTVDKKSCTQFSWSCTPAFFKRFLMHLHIKRCSELLIWQLKSDLSTLSYPIRTILTQRF